MTNPAVDATDHTDSGPLPGLEELWAETRGDARITIAVLDGPVDLSHPCFRGAELDQLATHLSGPADDGPATRHGTHVASVIFGQSDEPVRGIAPQCRGLIVPIFRDGPDGSLAPCSQVDLARAISQAVEAGAQVINISGGEFSPSGTAHPILADAARHAAERGALIVAAAGNQGCDCLHVPGALPSVLAVGAMNAQGEPLEFSNWGEAYRTQGVLAAGENIRGAAPGGGAAMQTGTSYATPVVSGVIGLLLSLQLKSGQAANPQGVRASVLETALDCTHQEAPDCRRVLAGRLNVAGAAAQIKQGVSNMSERSELQESATVESSEAAVETSDGIQTQEAAVAPAAAGGLAPAEKQAEITNDQVPMTNGGGESVAPAAAAPRAVLEEPAEAGEVRAATCGCGCGGNGPAQRVFALGTLGFDYGTEARRDSIAQHMKQPANPHDPAQLLAYLEDNPWDATEVIWTLNFDATPLYAVRPQGPFAGHASEQLRRFLKEQLDEGVERVSIPGWIVGSARLFTGQAVPVIHPVLRGMYSWTVAALVEAVCGKPPAAGAAQKDKDAYAAKAESLGNFVQRVYYELRNLGVTPQERAINYSATNALLVSQVFEQALGDDMQLDTIEVERSPLCRPDSDCWDVKLSFFDPGKLFERARKVYRFTIDVSDVVPVTVGPVRSWFVR